MNKEQHPQIRDKNQSYLILNNISKDANFGFLIRSANAFGAVPVVDATHLHCVAGHRAGLGQCAVFTGHDVQFGQLCAHQHAATFGVLFVLVFNLNDGFFARLCHLGFGGAVRQILFLLAFDVAQGG